uniref:Uncharacterized protein n=1 Tax=viral metagenome TaxID=1070528 RepID=A0A6C0HEH1_9ZZZZ
MKKSAAVMCPITMYPRTLVTAKNRIKYNTYLLVSTFDTELGTFIYIYNALNKKI